MDISNIVGAHDGGKALAGIKIVVGGWVRAGRVAGGGAFAFIEINDGSCGGTLQCKVGRSVAEAAVEAQSDSAGGVGEAVAGETNTAGDKNEGAEASAAPASGEAPSNALRSLAATGGALLLEGRLVETPEGTTQPVELVVDRVALWGRCDGAAYPLAKKKMTFEFLRGYLHLRPRTAALGAVSRIRSALALATHTFFGGEMGFKYVHTPVITTADCEGAGEMSQVTTLLGGAVELKTRQGAPGEAQIATARAIADAADTTLEELRMAAAGDDSEAKKAAKKAMKGAVAAAATARNHVDDVVRRSMARGGLPRLPPGDGDGATDPEAPADCARPPPGPSRVDYSEDFFSRPAYLTVSGQLEGEAYACALGGIYTFGPTFRAEDSNTKRHLAEFWMIEPEMAWCTLTDDMAVAEAYVRSCCRAVLRDCSGDVDVLVKLVDSGLRERLERVAEAPFARCSYTRAIELLEAEISANPKRFEFPVSWGADLASEHERWLAEEVFAGPVIVFDYPREIKSFYMRLNDDGRTVAAMDVLCPGVGELIGGSQREDRLPVLLERLTASGMSVEDYGPYLDLRRFGGVPHAGFGLGFERLVMFATGVDNIREALPYPRWPGHA